MTNDATGLFIADPNRTAMVVWNIKDIYTGDQGMGRYCPNVDDLVIDYERGFFRVGTVDYTTGLSTLVEVLFPLTTPTVTDEDIFLGVGPGATSESWRVYLDTRTMPYTLEVNGALKMYGSRASYIKIFRGTDVSAMGEVVSAYYDASGQFVSENIPMELVGTDLLNNRSIKAPLPGATSIKMDDGEVVTVVAYSATDHVISKAKMLIENTNLVRKSEAGRKYVKAISLRSPYLSDSDPTQLVVPINVDVRTISILGVVTYSNGDEVEIPVGLDGSSKMSLYGLKFYTPTIPTAVMPLTLKYTLSEDEYSVTEGVTINGSMTAPFSIKAVDADNSYSLKLFMYPVWKSVAARYELDFWLYNLDRDVFHRVPASAIETPSDSLNFNGSDFVNLQRLKIGVNLQALDQTYQAYRHVQSFEVALKQGGTNIGDKWLIKFDPTQSEYFGQGLAAKMTFINANQWTVNLVNGANSLTDWLRKLYLSINPLLDGAAEVTPPTPTHFVLHTKVRTYEYSVDQWSQDLAIINDLALGEVLYIRWIRRNFSTDLELGVTGLVVEQVN